LALGASVLPWLIIICHQLAEGVDVRGKPSGRSRARGVSGEGDVIEAGARTPRCRVAYAM